MLLLLALAVLIVPACGGGSGSRAAPPPEVIVLPTGSLVADSVLRNDFNYYAAAVVPGAFYKVSITGQNDDADLLVFDDSTFTFLAQCSIDNMIFTGVSPEDCVIRAPGGTLYFGVDGAFLAGPAGFYTIAVMPVATTGLALAAPHADSLGQWEARIYSVFAPVIDDYAISITGLSNDADLYVFGTDAFLTFPAACPNTQRGGTLPEDCTLLSTAGTLYFVVDGLFSTTAVVSYTALAAPAIP
jgi:hypothetical protein